MEHQSVVIERQRAMSDNYVLRNGDGEELHRADKMRVNNARINFESGRVEVDGVEQIRHIEEVNRGNINFPSVIEIETQDFY